MYWVIGTNITNSKFDHLFSMEILGECPKISWRGWNRPFQRNNSSTDTKFLHQVFACSNHTRLSEIYSKYKAPNTGWKTASLVKGLLIIHEGLVKGSGKVSSKGNFDYMWICLRRLICCYYSYLHIVEIGRCQQFFRKTCNKMMSIHQMKWKNVGGFGFRYNSKEKLPIAFTSHNSTQRLFIWWSLGVPKSSRRMKSWKWSP